MNKRDTVKILATLVYILVGLAALVSAIALLIDPVSMPWWTVISIVLLEIGGFNWGIKGLFSKDLFQLIGKY
jgi:uncharacterized membrane protein YuzA (DUF378 family)